MSRFRSILAICLAAITTLLVSCSNPSVTVKEPGYTVAQLEQIQQYTTDVEALRDRLQDIPSLVRTQKWNDVSSLIHGPLGELRTKMTRLARTLKPDAQKQALTVAQDIFDHLIAIDEASRDEDSRRILRNYNEAIADFDAFFLLAPQPSAPTA